MTRAECKQLLMICEATYPNFKNSNPQEVLDAWFVILEEFDYKTILGALKVYIHTSESAFAPSVSQLIAMTRKPKELSGPDEVSVWREIRQAIRRGIYYHEEDFPKLSPIAQRLVGDPQQLREWACLPSEDIDNDIHKDIVFRFKALTERDKEISALPSEVRAQIGGENGNQLKRLPDMA